MDISEWKEVQRKLKDEWSNLWNDRFDDKVQAESIANDNYDMLSIEKGTVIFAPKDARVPSFREIEEAWKPKDCFREYIIDPRIGGWKKFVRTEISEGPISQKKRNGSTQQKKEFHHKKKGGRGWLHCFK